MTTLILFAEKDIPASNVQLNSYQSLMETLITLSDKALVTLVTDIPGNHYEPDRFVVPFVVL